MGKFQDVLINEAEDISTLPLLHTCDAYSLRSILESLTLIPQQCDVFRIDLLYTYYGLPSYRPHHKKATSNPAYFMICLILESEQFNDFHKIYPFDSGAFHKVPEMKENFFHNKTEILEFELDTEILSAKKVIKTFYETNKNYLNQQPKLSKEFSVFDFEANGYNNLISNNADGILDDRASSIEVIFDKKILLSKETVKQIIIPNCFKDDEKVSSLIRDNFGIEEPLGYGTSRGNPNESFGQIRTEYFNFIKSN